MLSSDEDPTRHTPSASGRKNKHTQVQSQSERNKRQEEKGSKRRLVGEESRCEEREAMRGECAISGIRVAAEERGSEAHRCICGWS